MVKAQLTTEIKDQIRKENSKLVGTKNSRAIKLTKLFPYARLTISKVIEIDTPKTRCTVPFTNNEKEAIIKAYNASVEINHSQRLKAIATLFNRSSDAVRRIIKQNDQQSENKLFDHRKFYF